MAVKKSARFASVHWQIGDVQSLQPDWDDKRCAEFLRANAKWIQDAMVRAGWDAMESCITWEQGRSE